MMKLPITLSVLPVFVATCMAAQDAEPIRWDLRAGDKLQATHQQTTRIETNIDNRRKEIGNDMLLVVDWEVTKAGDEQIEMTQSINRIKLDIRRPSKTAVETMVIDTDAKDEPGSGLANDLKNQVLSLIGTEFNVVMTTRGEIVQVTIPDASKETIRAAPASMFLRQVLTSDGLRDIIGQSAFTFPRDASQKQWTIRSTTANALGKLDKITEISYQGKSDRNGVDAHTFALTSNIQTIDAADGDDAPSIDEYSGSGRAWFSPDSSPVYQSEFENRMNVTRRYRDQKIVSVVSTTNQMRVVKQ